MISLKEITKLGELARIKLTEEEKKEFQRDIGAVLDYFKKLQEFKIKNYNETETKFAEGENLNEFRDDENVNKEGEYSEILLWQTPNKKNWHIKVKKIL